MSRTLLAVLLVAVAACTSPEPRRAPSPSATSSPAPAPAVREDLAIVLAPPGTPEAVLSGAFREAAGRLDVRALEPPDEGFRRDLLVLLADERTELVCAVGGVVDVVAVADEFPNGRFCVIGDAAADPPDNVMFVPWPLDEGARLAGVGAALVAPDITIVGPRPDDIVAAVSDGARSVREDTSVTVAATLTPAVPGRVVIPVGTPAEVRATVGAASASDRILVGWMADPRDLVDGALPLAVSVVADVEHLVATLLERDADPRFSIVSGTGPRARDIARRVTAARG